MGEDGSRDPGSSIRSDLLRDTVVFDFLVTRVQTPMPSRAPLFSTYRQGENRITGSLIAVLQRIDAEHVARLLSAVSAESDLPFISFTNQAAGSEGSVPDAEIRANFHYLFEVKTVPNAVRREQLEGHLKHLEGPTANQRLFVVTPDPDRPVPVMEINDEKGRIVWFNFRSLDRALDDLLEDRTELISEQEQFLLRELRALFAHEGLLDHRDVVIVAARQAYPEYLATNAYVCQPGRAFRTGISRLGFYAESEIKRELPVIRHREDNVLFTTEEAAARMQNPKEKPSAEVGALIAKMLEEGRRGDGEPHLVFLLSAPESSDTIRLENAVINDKVDKNGKRWPWTLGQAYANLDALHKSKTTSTLDSFLN
jgi:hypothetical protein